MLITRSVQDPEFAGAGGPEWSCLETRASLRSQYQFTANTGKVNFGVRRRALTMELRASWSYRRWWWSRIAEDLI